MSNVSNTGKKGVLNTGFNQLYNQVFCKQLYPNSQFISIPNSTFGPNLKGTPNNVTSKESDCLENCLKDDYCTAYTYDKTLGSNSLNCTLYRNNFPNEIISGSPGKNSGYSLQFSYDYNSLTDDQKKNVQQKCVNQYLNNINFPGQNIDLTSAIKFKKYDYDTTNISTDPSILYKLYSQNGIPTKILSQPTYVLDAVNVNMKSISDPVIDNYSRSYDTFMQNQAISANVQNVVKTANPDNDNLIQTLQTSNSDITDEYITGRIKVMDDIEKSVVSQIGNEKFTNKIDSESIYEFNYNIVLVIIILIIIFFIITTIILNMKKIKQKK